MRYKRNGTNAISSRVWITCVIREKRLLLRSTPVTLVPGDQRGKFTWKTPDPISSLALRSHSVLPTAPLPVAGSFQQQLITLPSPRPPQHRLLRTWSLDHSFSKHCNSKRNQATGQENCTLTTSSEIHKMSSCKSCW